MRDPRMEQLAKNLIGYSTDLKENEKILIEVHGEGLPLARELVRETYRIGGIPFVTVKDPQTTRILLEGCSRRQMADTGKFELARMKEMQAYIGIRASQNVSEMGAVPADRMKLYQEEYMTPLHSEQRVRNTRWCVLRYPNNSMAQLADMATEGFEELYFKVCNLDYSRMSAAMDALVELMGKTDRVRIKGEGTDLSFSIKGLPAIKCDGKFNIPDGEVYTAPVRDSVNGQITYNVPAVYQGVTFENIRFVFVNGRIEEARSNNTKRLCEILDTDEGARYTGEFSLGVNPHIQKPMKDTLFDEKINGSFHLTPGRAYDKCDNGNRSSIHWDLVCIQRPEYGGGEIWFDDTLIRKDGVFTEESLKGLNPENLV